MDKIQILRKISQTFFFIYFVFLVNFCLCFFGILEKIILKGTIGQIIFKLVGIVFLTLIFGRVFCGWICPLGFLFELSYKLRAKLFKIKKLSTVDEKIHNKLKYLKYIIFIVSLILTYHFSTYVYCQVCPIGFLTNLHGTVLSFIIFITFIIASFFIPMAFCRYFCPLGAFLSIFSIKPLFQLKTTEKCNKCRLCSFKCPMQIKIAEKIDQKECIRCFECKSACRKKALSFSTVFDIKSFKNKLDLKDH
ncbi:4Fe-4S binding protein [Methanocaldococcus fervens]|uniref:4Fe-4S ferredoxin iron-sulfur binding domain protein n=1 Tax=Methanocaldococcus fervens (strain DSM 4213 / JCM 15782 / AG86) TaxID=573064 RepID=C7P8H4_METFA|nr:4Fe-4S binding protein [Methanocaldococcus fervens]ACV24856.1 4Fe-4S ferredoxin iron-sulfur binding domain protein [Methanocaldococcus fervens AG86]